MALDMKSPFSQSGLGSAGYLSNMAGSTFNKTIENAIGALNNYNKGAQTIQEGVHENAQDALKSNFASQLAGMDYTQAKGFDASAFGQGNAHMDSALQSSFMQQLATKQATEKAKAVQSLQDQAYSGFDGQYALSAITKGIHEKDAQDVLTPEQENALATSLHQRNTLQRKDAQTSGRSAEIEKLNATASEGQLDKEQYDRKLAEINNQFQYADPATTKGLEALTQNRFNLTGDLKTGADIAQTVMTNNSQQFQAVQDEKLRQAEAKLPLAKETMEQLSGPGSINKAIGEFGKEFDEGNISNTYDQAVAAISNHKELENLPGAALVLMKQLGKNDDGTFNSDGIEDRARRLAQKVTTQNSLSGTLTGLRNAYNTSTKDAQVQDQKTYKTLMSAVQKAAQTKDTEDDKVALADLNSYSQSGKQVKTVKSDTISKAQKEWDAAVAQYIKAQQLKNQGSTDGLTSKQSNAAKFYNAAYN